MLSSPNLLWVSRQRPYPSPLHAPPPCSDMSSNVRETLPGAADRVKVGAACSCVAPGCSCCHPAAQQSHSAPARIGAAVLPRPPCNAAPAHTLPRLSTHPHPPVALPSLVQDATGNVGQAVKEDAINAKDRAADAGASARDAAAVRRDEASVRVMGCGVASWLGKRCRH